jgi:hypothetical protein
MTPFLGGLRAPQGDAAAADPCPPVLVNSESAPWLAPNSAPSRPQLRQRPDLFRSWEPFVAMRDGGAGQRCETAGPGRARARRSDSAASRTPLCSALAAAPSCTRPSSSSRRRTSARWVAFRQAIPRRCLGVLFDADRFWLYESFAGNPVRLVRGEWVLPGSRAFVRGFFAGAPEPPLASLLRDLLRELGTSCLAVHGRCYLGSGAYGHVFRVGDAAAPRALKAVLSSQDQLFVLDAEFETLLSASKRGAPVVAPVEGSLRVLDSGGGYLMESVEEEFDASSRARCDAAFLALAGLHRCGVAHGDPRTSNLLLVGGAPRWVDLRGSAVVAGGGPSAVSIRVDADILARSILCLPPLASTPVDVGAALAGYEPESNEAVATLSAAVWAAKSAR